MAEDEEARRPLPLADRPFIGGGMLSMLELAMELGPGDECMRKWEEEREGSSRCRLRARACSGSVAVGERGRVAGTAGESRTGCRLGEGTSGERMGDVGGSMVADAQ